MRRSLLLLQRLKNGLILRPPHVEWRLCEEGRAREVAQDVRRGSYAKDGRHGAEDGNGPDPEVWDGLHR